jgi:hypothetical protein
VFIFLPCIAFLILFRAFRIKGQGRRAALLRAATLWWAFLVAATELLSIHYLLTRGWIALAWTLFCVVGFAYLFFSRTSSPSGNGVSHTLPSTGSKRLSKTEEVLLVSASVLLAGIGLLAVVAPPNTWDAMNYHLPRMIFWTINHSVRFYPTPDYAQLIFGPGAEFATLHSYLLWGGDRFVNLVEFSSFLGVIVGASLIAEKLGAGLRGQVLAAIVAATIPEALLEASGAMNTLVVTFWIVTAAYFMLAAQETTGWSEPVLAALAVGLALLTKGSAYVLLPFVLLCCWWMGSSTSRIRMLRRLPVLALLVLLVNVGQFWRCFQLTGSPIGLPFPDGGPRLHWMNDKFSASATAANMLRNASLHLSTRSDSINAHTEGIVRKAILLLGEQPDDPKTIWPGRPFHIITLAPLETTAGNSVHFVLILVVFGLLLLGWRDPSNRRSMWFALGLLASFVLFCTLLRWQEWEGRHHLPLFALAAALIGVQFEKYFSKTWTTVAAAALLVLAIPFVLFNGMRAWVPWGKVTNVYHARAELYFGDGGHDVLYPAYAGIAREILESRCHDIAIQSYLPGPESEMTRDATSFYVYPLFALLRVDRKDLHLSYTGVTNKTAVLSQPAASNPSCAVICLDCVGHPASTGSYVTQGGKESIFGNNEVFIFPAAQGGTRGAN